MVLATLDGTASYGVDIPAGDYELGGRYFSSSNIVGALFRDGALTTSEKTEVEGYFVDNGATVSHGAVTNFNGYWRGSSEITEFPLVDTSSGTHFERTWQDTGFDSFPLVDTSSAVSLYASWYRSKLTSFPLIDTSSVMNFRATWLQCTLLQDFPANAFDNIKSSDFYCCLRPNKPKPSINRWNLSLFSNFRYSNRHKNI